MITFITAVILLVLGYIFYEFVESIFKPDVNRATPAYTHADGVDFVPMDSNRNSLIQVLNIAGVGPFSDQY
jgi:carbon starvation protein CstA